MSNLPKGWKLVQLNDIVKFNNGKGHEQYIDDNGEYIVVNSKFISTNGEIRKYSNENLSPLKKGDITLVMSDIPNGRALAKCYLIEEDNKYTLNQRICSLEVKNENNEFLFYKLNRNQYFLKFNDGVNQTNLRKNEVLDCPVELPPLEEQKKIADILSTVDEKIAFVQDSINQTEELKKALMQKLLTEGIGHTEFKDSELGKIPKSWRIVKLEEVCSKIVGGGTPSKNESTYWENGTIDWFSSGELNQLYTLPSKEKITQLGLEKTSTKLFSKGTLLIGMYDTAAMKMSILFNDGSCNQAIVGFKSNENELNILFLKYQLEYLKKDILEQRQGVRQQNLNLSKIKNIEIEYPPLKTQQKVVSYLDEISNKMEKIKQIQKEKMQSLKALKASILDQAFKGEL